MSEEIKPKTKIIPGFQRYTIDENGVVVNTLTEKVMTPDPLNLNRVRIVDDNGKRQWFNPATQLPEIFKQEPPVESDPYTKEIVSDEQSTVGASEVWDVDALKEKHGSIERLSSKKVQELESEKKRHIHCPRKMSKDDVVQFRIDHAAGTITVKQAEQKYGVGVGTLGKILRRLIHKDV